MKKYILALSLSASAYFSYAEGINTEKWAINPNNVAAISSKDHLITAVTYSDDEIVHFIVGRKRCSDFKASEQTRELNDQSIVWEIWCGSDFVIWTPESNKAKSFVTNEFKTKNSVTFGNSTISAKGFNSVNNTQRKNEESAI